MIYRLYTKIQKENSVHFPNFNCTSLYIFLPSQHHQSSQHLAWSCARGTVFGENNIWYHHLIAMLIRGVMVNSKIVFFQTLRWHFADHLVMKSWAGLLKYTQKNIALHQVDISTLLYSSMSSSWQLIAWKAIFTLNL